MTTDFENFIQGLLDEFSDNAGWETDYKKALKNNNIEGMYDVGRYECLTGIMREIRKQNKNYCDIAKVITVLLDPDDMETVNKSTGIDVFATENWCDYSTFVAVDEAINFGDDTKTDIKQFVSNEHFDLLKNSLVDYIAFRLDC